MQKIAFIVITYKTERKTVERLEKEIEDLGIGRSCIYLIDNTQDNRGYAAGVNKGIKKAIKDGANIFVAANPDISLTGLNMKMIEGAKHFDIWGLTMKQDRKIYYGGVIDKWRMSGGLIDKKPETRFKETDFVTGSLIFMKKQVVDEIGLWDEGYIMYYEDVDYCFRARKAGFKVGIDTELRYEHFETSKTNKEKDRYLTKNRLRFFMKYASMIQILREIIRIPKTIWEYIALNR